MRDSQISAEHSPDIEWVEWMLEKLGYQYDIFSSLSASEDADVEGI